LYWSGAAGYSAPETPVFFGDYIKLKKLGVADIFARAMLHPFTHYPCSLVLL
jgi:hypothetical protein